MRWFRRLYDWTMRWSESPHAMTALFVLALVESFIFPIPPDLLLIAICVGVPRQSMRFALVCSVGSVIGGIIGYAIGHYFMDSVGNYIVQLYGAEAIFATLQQQFQDHAVWTIAIAGFTPIPYKIFTVSSGAFGIDFGLFVLLSSLSRSARFFLVAGLIYRFGPQIRGMIDRYFNLLTVALAVLFVLGVLAVKWFA